MNTIGQNIAYFRKQKNMTQEELAEKMAVTAQAVSKWECDTSYPDIVTLQTLAKILAVDVAELIEGPRNVSEILEASPEAINRRIVLIKVQAEGANVICRFPVAAVKKAIENGMLKKMIGEESYQEVAGVFDMVDLGVTGPLVEVDAAGAHVYISVENYED